MLRDLIASFVLVVAMLTATGCRPQLVLQMGGGVSPERIQWEQNVTERVNNYEERLQALEKGDQP